MSILFLIAAAAFIATFIGGYFAVKFRDQLHLILGFSAGAVVGVAFFDLLPEAISLGTHYYEVDVLTLAIAFGFLLYLFLDRLILLHTHGEDAEDHAHHAHRGILGASTLSTHSFLDGVAIGFGFQISSAIGIIIAAAVLTHDFSDGINTVNVILKNGGSRREAFQWLVTDAATPVLGILSTLVIRIPEHLIGIVLAIFTGSFIYLGASDLIPESHHRHPRALTTVMTICGALALYFIVRIAG
ncbi:MAG TPA: ZIP family metal transporter [Candidatus Paceibacterota bacterium]|nr:ZIP family metal transporter [Candidatus Paceibacterota bacterium]